MIKVKVIEIDDKGRINVSAKDLLEKPKKEEKHESRPAGEVRFFGKKKDEWSSFY